MWAFEDAEVYLVLGSQSGAHVSFEFLAWV